MIALYLTTETWALDSALIRWDTRCPYSHVGFVNLGPEGITYLSAHFSGGVLVRQPDKEKVKLHLYLTAPKIEEAYAWALTQVGKPYDTTAIFGLAADRNWRNEDAWFCSELVAAAFEYAGGPLLNPVVAVWRITPRDILLSEMVKEISSLTLAPIESISRAFHQEPSIYPPPVGAKR